MACNSIFIYTASTDTTLCTSGGTYLRVYGDDTVIPFPSGTTFFTDSSCLIPIVDTFYFINNSYVYDYNGKTQGDGVLCPTPTPTPTQTETQRPTSTPTPTLTQTLTQTPTLTTTVECKCNYVDIVVKQADLDSAFGNTNPSLNGSLFYVYTQCADPNPPVERQYTTDGNYNNDVCILTNQFLSSFFYYYQNDLPFDSINNPELFSSTATLDGCCTEVVTPTPTPTMETQIPTPTPTITTPPCYCLTSIYTGSVSPSIVQYSDCSSGTSIITVYPNTPFSICFDGVSLINTNDPSTIFEFVSLGTCSDGKLCDGVTPTPTPTLTETSSPTPTPTLTETEGLTPTPTPTITETSTPTPTPTLTETSTPTQTPTPTLTETEGLTPTPTPTETACSICVCWVLEYTGSSSPATIRYTNCSNSIAFYSATPNIPFSLCYCNGTSVDVIEDPMTSLQTISLGLCSDGVNCDEPPATPTPTPTLTPTETESSKPTSTPTPTPTQTQTSTPTPTPTITPTSTSSTCFTDYCISNTGEPTWNDQYVLTGTYNSKDYWEGVVNGLFIYYDTTNTQWCLSDSLGGSCYLTGKSPCSSICPDLCSDYFTIGLCPTPTPTPTGPCNINYDIVFGCETDTTPTPTPTPTITSTPTLTPTPTDICASLSVDATITSTTPTPTPTSTLTPTPTAPISRPFNLTGNVTFNTLDEVMICPQSKQFQDCYNGTMYYTTGTITTPSGDTLEQFMVFEALVDGTSRCISYVGENNDIIGINIIDLRNGPYGYSNLGECINCNTFVTPTPTPTNSQTPTPTLTPTRTLTPTPSSGSVQTYYVFKKCDNTNTYVIQTQPASINTPGTTFFNVGDLNCWTYLNQYVGAVPLNPSFNIINYSGNYFTSVGPVTYGKCGECVSAQTTTTTTTTTALPLTCRVPYVHYKTSACARTSGYIKVNGVIVYSFDVSIGVGSYNGSILVTTGDIVEFNFNCLSPNPACSTEYSMMTLGISPLNLSYSAMYGSSAQIIETLTVDSSWCNPQTQIVITSSSVGL